MADDRWGPFRLPLNDPERAPQFRSLAALTKAFIFNSGDLVRALRAAETSDAEAAKALELLYEVPTRTRRNIISTFGAVTYS